MVTEAEFQEAIDTVKAANLIKVKNVLERFFQENVELRAKLTATGIVEATSQAVEKGGKNGKPSSSKSEE